MSSLRTYLVLGRVSNLPTVWANVLCGLLLTSLSFSPVVAGHLFVGLSLLYIGGMYMNDFCDAAYDQAAGKDRPIVTGAITQARVRLITAFLIGGGIAAIVLIGPRAAIWGGVLVVLISAYNITHKRWAYAFVLMAACRSVIYFIVAEAAVGEIASVVKIAAAAQFFYICGITLLARHEESSRSFNSYGLLFLGIGAGIPLVYLVSYFETQGIATGALLLAWIALSLYKARTGTSLVPGKSIPPLLAGICLLDLALLGAFAAPYFAQAATFAAFFALTLIFQRFIPAS